MGARVATPCPKCASTRCRESRWSSHGEKADNPGMYPYRCTVCSHRFIAPAGAARSSVGGRHPLLTAVAAAVVIGVVAGIIGLLWPEAQQAEQVIAPVATPDAPADGAHPSVEAARAGDPEAQYRVGRAALNDIARGKEATSEGLAWLTQAAEGGHTAAMLKLGKLYRNGVGVPQNYEFAEKWVRAAAEAGNSEAMVELGRFYRAGVGVKADAVKAYVWFNRAAAAMNMEGVHERDIIGLKLSAEDLKAAQAESLAAELESPATAREALASD